MLEISREKLLGLLELCANFATYKTKNGALRPRFIIKMVPENRMLLEAIRIHLRVNPRVHQYFSGGRHYVVLTISSLGELKTKVVPALKGGLRGAQEEKLIQWLKTFRYLDPVRK